MARRRGENEEPAFGSDSFLDVIANIVGILIILIVLVGLRVKYAPPSSDTARSSQAQAEMALREWQTQADAIYADNQRARMAYEDAEKEVRDEEERRLAQAAMVKVQQEAIDRQRDEHSAELKRREAILKSYETEAQRLQAELDALEADLATALDEKKSREDELMDRENATSGRLNSSQRQMTELQGKIEGATTLLTNSEEEGKKLRDRLTALSREVAGMEKTKPPQKIFHYGTPLARKVDRHELHFRCLGGRVAYTYLDELFEATKDQARARITPSTSKLDGVAGPIGGFRLKYTLARPLMSVADQLAELQLVRFALVYWELTGDSELIGETPAEALAPHSSFRIKLGSAPAKEHGVTLWVYPDSFKAAKEVETFLHERGYVVALRPLPMGIPIIGSPLGTATHSH